MPALLRMRSMTEFRMANYIQAREHWGTLVADGLWRRLQKDRIQARVTPDEHERLRDQPDARDVCELTGRIARRSEGS